MFVGEEQKNRMVKILFFKCMGVAFVSPFEKMNIITTPKHFVANVGDGGRDSYPINWNERLLDEIYLPPFKHVLIKAVHGL